jgi:hypothetical protein
MDRSLLRLSDLPELTIGVVFDYNATLPCLLHFIDRVVAPTCRKIPGSWPNGIAALTFYQVLQKKILM